MMVKVRIQIRANAKYPKSQKSDDSIRGKKVQKAAGGGWAPPHMMIEGKIAGRLGAAAPP